MKLPLLIALLATTPALAATHKYTLQDHPDATRSEHSYGFVIGGNVQRFWSFDQGPGTTLVYDDIKRSVTISGQMRESLGNGRFGDLWHVNYTLTDVNQQPTGFTETRCTGSGSIRLGGSMYDLGCKANTEGVYASFLQEDDDGHLTLRAWTNPGDFIGVVSQVSLPAMWLAFLSGLLGLLAIRRVR